MQVRVYGETPKSSARGRKSCFASWSRSTRNNWTASRAGSSTDSAGCSPNRNATPTKRTHHRRRRERPSGAPQSAPHVSAGEAEAARGEGSGAPESADARAYAELHDRYLRLSADLQNLRKRMEREVEERSRRKSEGLLNGILGGLDELDRALAHLPDGRQGQDPLVQGVSLIREALIRAASQAGVREIPTVGTPFDPKIHEAIATIPTADAPGPCGLRAPQRLPLGRSGPSAEPSGRRRGAESHTSRNQRSRRARLSPPDPKPKFPCPPTTTSATRAGTPSRNPQSMKDARLRDCPKCGKSKLRRLIGAGAGIIFKGSGFYQTDYKNGGSSSKPSAPPPPNPMIRPRETRGRRQILRILRQRRAPTSATDHGRAEGRPSAGELRPLGPEHREGKPTFPRPVHARVRVDQRMQPALRDVRPERRSPVQKVGKEKAAPFLEKAFESVVIWNPSATSEPLLNDIDEIVRLCQTRGVYLELYTNATLLSPANLERLAPGSIGSRCRSIRMCPRSSSGCATR